MDSDLGSLRTLSCGGELVAKDVGAEIGIESRLA